RRAIAARQCAPARSRGVRRRRDSERVGDHRSSLCLRSSARRVPTGIRHHDERADPQAQRETGHAVPSSARRLPEPGGHMTADRFEATFTVSVEREVAWQRLTDDLDDKGWLPGFDATVAVVDTDDTRQLHATKTDEPCAGTDIVVTLEDDSTGTRIHVVQ